MRGGDDVALTAVGDALIAVGDNEAAAIANSDDGTDEIVPTDVGYAGGDVLYGFHDFPGARS
ncbi:MAG: hypothetical protein WA397_02160 [Roseiarcus sp.]